MPSWTQRYVSGDWESVWEEIGSLEDVPAALQSDVDGVAEATMRKVRSHVDRLAEAYLDAGLVVEGIPVRTPATPADLQRLQEVQDQIRPIPAALRWCLTEVGGLWLSGDCPAFGLYYDQREPQPVAPIHPDPLVLPDIAWLSSEWDEFLNDDERDYDDATFWFSFAPDEHHKANISGSTHDIELPQACPDPALHGVWQLKRSITLIQYLRLSIAWAGCTGWSLAPDHMPEALQRLRTTPGF